MQYYAIYLINQIKPGRLSQNIFTALPVTQIFTTSYDSVNDVGGFVEAICRFPTA